MLSSKSGTTIIEAIIVTLIVVVWIMGTYGIFINSQKLSDSTGNRLVAIAIAREWIEAVTNIRDTNWIAFAANNNNCWFTHNYNSSCITDTTKYVSAWSYILTSNSNNRWELTLKTSWVYSNAGYKTDFRVNKDTNGFYTQSGWTTFLPLYTREIKISYPSGTGTPPQSVNIESIVRWSDSSRNNGNYEVKLENILTNWKKE